MLIIPSFKKTYRKILILGSGDCGAAREIIKLNPNAIIKVIDIDPEVTKAIEKYISKVLLMYLKMNETD